MIQLNLPTALRLRRGLRSCIFATTSVATLACMTRATERDRPANYQQTQYARANSQGKPASGRVAHAGEVFIQPFDQVPAWQIEALRSALVQHYRFKVEVLPSRPLPSKTFYPRRNRYRADRLLNHLDRVAPAARHKVSKILGITTQDISTTKDSHEDWGVFGLGRIGGRSAIVSSHRLRPRGARPSAGQTHKQWTHRLRVMAIHEIGHTLGLQHCQEHGDHCPMRAAQGGSTIVDDSLEVLGPNCLTRLAAARKTAPAARKSRR